MIRIPDTLSVAEFRTLELVEWCNRHGIRSRDLGCSSKFDDNGRLVMNLNPHPQIDDVMILVKWRDAIKDIWTKSEQKTFELIWQWCYHNALPLKKKHLKALEFTYIKATERASIKASKKAKAINKIKAQRNKQS
jgi:hypothetical protein